MYYLKAHILPFEYRLKYKVCLTVFKCLHNIAPVYLADLLHPYASLESLRSSNESYLLETTISSSKSFSRCFYNYAPILWNELPNDIRSIDTITTFMTALKTHFFREYENFLLENYVV